MRLERLRPALEGRRTRSELHGSPLTEARVRGLEVLDQDAPRDAVDGEMVNRDEQPARLVGSEVEVRRAQKRAG